MLQPAARAHRAGSDALLLAAALPAGASGRLADLGAGVGVAGLAALAANPALTVDLVEREPAMVALAQAGLALPGNEALAARARVVALDIAAGAGARREAGLVEASIDHVIANPPWNPPVDRASPHGLRRAAHVMEPAALEPWLRTAAALLRPGGTVCLIHRAERLADLLAPMAGRFGGLEVMPLHASAERPAGRVVLRAVRGSRAPLRLHRGLVLHEADGRATALAEALLNGEARLFPD